MSRLPVRLLLGAAALVTIGARPPVGPLRLGLPLQCHIGSDCFVQTYVDQDPGPGTRDFMCGARTNDKHNGTDFRVRSFADMAKGVPVVAVAPGRVLRVRDGVPDVSVKVGGRAAVANEECGNGLVIDNGHGWETQYCHLAKGSLTVKPGRYVRAGWTLGNVGLSGDTEFPHVHLIVRKDGKVVDPFAYGATPGSCGGGMPLWKERIGYQAGQVLVAGFATRAVSLDEAQATGAAQTPVPTRDGPALVAFVKSIGLQKGDVQRIRLRAPNGQIVVDAAGEPLPRDQAESIWSVGRRTPPGGWAPGLYQAEFSVHRNDVDLIMRTFRITL